MKTQIVLAVAGIVLASSALPAQAPTVTNLVNDAAHYVGKAPAPIRTTTTQWTTSRSRLYIRSQVKAAGWSDRQWQCLKEIVWRESRFNHKADNPTSSAYGLFQILKMKPGTPVPHQVKKGLRYIKHRYGTACVALAFHNKNGWY